MAFYILPAHKQVSLFAGVSATVDTDYTDDWLCDGRPGRPVRSTNTSLTATVTTTAGTVSMAVLSHHNVTVSATLGGDLSGSILAGAVGKNGIPLNPFLTFSPVASVDSTTLTISGNAATVVLGEFYFGEYLTLALPPFYRDFSVDENGYARSVDMDLSSVPPYDPGLKGRTMQAGWPAMTTADRDILIEAFDAQRGNTRCTVVVPFSTVNDAWVGFITKLGYKPSDVPNRWEVSLTFQEVPRVRW